MCGFYFDKRNNNYLSKAKYCSLYDLSLLWSGGDASHALKIQATMCCQVILETEIQWMTNEIIVSDNKLLWEHLVHPHLYWQHNVNNCIRCKTSIKSHPPHTPSHFLKTNFETWSSYLTSSTTYLKHHSSCRKYRKRFPLNQCKIAGEIKKNNAFPLSFLLNIEIIRILSSSPKSSTPPPPPQNPLKLSIR